MVVNDHDAINTPPASVLQDVGQITGVGLPELAEGVLLKCLSISHIGGLGPLQVVALDVALDGAHAHGGGDKGILDELAVDLGGVEPGKCLLEPVDFLNGRVRKGAGGSLVRALNGHQRVDAAPLVLGHPAGNGVWAILNCSAVRQGEGLFGDTLIIGIAGSVRIKIVDHRGDDGKPELGDCRRVGQRCRFFHGQDLLILVCFQHNAALAGRPFRLRVVGPKRAGLKKRHGEKTPRLCGVGGRKMLSLGRMVCRNHRSNRTNSSAGG